ncbi:MAG TPA: nuclear transport factor 2 family protein [Actinomycetes bacterium]
MSQNETAARQVLELGERWAAAELRADIGTLDDVLHERFMGVGPLGFVLDKRAWLGPRQAGDLRISSFAWREPDVRLLGDTALVIGVQEQRATHRDQDADGRFRVTQVVVRDGDRWRIAGMHLSPIMAPPGR